MWDAQIYPKAETRSHVEQLELELKKNPDDTVLRRHIKQLRKAWGLRNLKKAA